MALVETEQVLVIPTEHFHKLGHFQGFSHEVDKYFEHLLQPEQTSYRPRGEMEEDPNFKQLIPYCLFRYSSPDGVTSLFAYTRGKGQGEKRLHAKRSVGVGGHISLDDHAAESGSPYQEGLARELSEEVLIETPYRETCVGLINDDETAVGKVHLGVVHILDVEEPAVTSRETDLLEAGFRPVDSLLAELDQFETWSQICLSALFR